MPPGEVYDPEKTDGNLTADELAKAEKAASSQPTGSASSSTRPGRISYSTDKPGPKTGGSTSSSTVPGKTKYSSSSEIPAAEASLYKSSSTKPGKIKFGTLFGTRKRKLIGLGTGLAGGGIIAFLLFFLPALRLESYLSSIDNRALAGASNAVQSRLKKDAETFLVSTLKQCGNKVVTGELCKTNYSSFGIARGMYNIWRDAKVDRTLIKALDLTIQFHKNPLPGQPRYRLFQASTGQELTITDKGLAEGKFTGGSRVLGNALNEEAIKKIYPHWYQILKRRSFRMSLKYRFGIKFWCLFACAQKDTIDRRYKDPVTKLKYKLVQRIIYPFSTKYGVIMDCILQGGGPECSADALRHRHIDVKTLDAEELQKIEETFYAKDSKGNVIKDKDGKPIIIKRNFLGVMTERLLTRIMTEASARQVVSVIPVAGQVYLALTVIDMFNQMDQMIKHHALSKFAADLNARQYAEYYSAMQSSNDEMKAHQLSLGQVGALADQFGGDQPAETSRIYQSYNDPGRSLASMAATEAASKTPFLCPSGDPIPPNAEICPENKVARTFKIEDIRNNKLVNGLATILNNYQRCPTFTLFGACIGPRPSTIIHPILKAINKIASDIFSGLVKAILSFLKAIPFVRDIVKYAEKYTAELLQAFMTKVFPLPVYPDSHGRIKYDGLEGGAEITASEFGAGGYAAPDQPYGLGGQKLSDGQQTLVMQQFNHQQDEQYAHSSLYAKLTNLDYPGSLGNRLVHAAPTSMADFFHKFASAVARPFASLFFTNGVAHAGGTLQVQSPFGITHNGYAANDPNLTASPSKFTPEFCDQAKKDWEDAAHEDKITGFISHSITNPCMLEQQAVVTGASGLTQQDGLDDSIGKLPKTKSP